MKIRSSRLYSYPVLSPMYDNYKNSKFEIKVRAYKKVKTLSLNIDCLLDNKEILSLIDQHKAEIVCHFECQKTKLRYTKLLSVGENLFDIPSASINEQLQIIAFVVLKEDIKNFYSKDFDVDYSNSTFDLEIGSVLAISNQPDIPIIKDIYDLSNVPSIISIVPYENSNDHKIYIDMDSEKIMVRLQKEDYKKYSTIGKGVSEYTPILHSTLIIPALTYVFDMLKSDEETFHSYENKRWFNALEKKFESMDKKLSFDDLKNQDPFLISQEILEVPIAETLTNLQTLRGE